MSKLRRAFRQAAAPLVLAVSAACAGIAQPNTTPAPARDPAVVHCDTVKQFSGKNCEDFSERSLTMEERDLAQKFFGAQIGNYGEISIAFNADSLKNVKAAVMHTDSTKIYVFGHYGYSINYAFSNNPDETGIFFHELTHVWQHQNRHKFDNKKIYKYEIFHDTGFTTLPTESQAALIDDYVRVYLCEKSYCPREERLYGYEKNIKPHLKGTAEDRQVIDAFYENMAGIIERQFPGARALRDWYADRTVAQDNAPAVRLHGPGHG